MDKWGLYEILKGNMAVSNEAIYMVEVMDTVDLREGVLEYLSLLKQEKNKSPPPFIKDKYLENNERGYVDEGI